MQRRISGAARDRRRRLLLRPSGLVVSRMGDSRSGGELLGVVAADETADSPGCEDDDHPADDADDADWRREKENLKLGRRYVGKTGLVAEMRLSRGILGQRRAAPRRGWCRAYYTQGTVVSVSEKLTRFWLGSSMGADKHEGTAGRQSHGR